MYKKIIGVLTISCSLFLGQAAFAHYHCPHKFNQMIASLKLEGEQKEKVKEIVTRMDSSLHEIASHMDGLRKQIHEQIELSTTDQSKLDALIDEKTRYIGDMMKAKTHAKHDIFQLLNDKQKAEFKNQLAAQENEIADMFKKCGKEDKE